MRSKQNGELKMTSEKLDTVDSKYFPGWEQLILCEGGKEAEPLKKLKKKREERGNENTGSV